jgi:hypothetical protein
LEGETASTVLAGLLDQVLRSDLLGSSPQFSKDFSKTTQIPRLGLNPGRV